MPSTVVMLAPSTDPTGHRQELMAVNLSLPGRLLHTLVVLMTTHQICTTLGNALRATECGPVPVAGS